jgi:hypothetical protein
MRIPQQESAGLRDAARTGGRGDLGPGQQERGGYEDRDQMHGKLHNGAYRLNAGERRPGSGNSRA